MAAGRKAGIRAANPPRECQAANVGRISVHEEFRARYVSKTGGQNNHGGFISIIIVNKYCNHNVYQENVMLKFMIIITIFSINHDAHSADIQNVRIV